MNFFKCDVCGNVVAFLYNSGAKLTCCNLEMKELIPKKKDEGMEKHVPVYCVEGCKVNVKVGDVEHPMQGAHYIEWIALETESGNQRKILKPGDKPEAVFYIGEKDKVKHVYAYCNVHGLWEA